MSVPCEIPKTGMVFFFIYLKIYVAISLRTVQGSPFPAKFCKKLPFFTALLESLVSLPSLLSLLKTFLLLLSHDKFYSAWLGYTEVDRYSFYHTIPVWIL